MNAPTRGNAGSPALADFVALNEELAALVRARFPLEPQLARIGEEMPGKAGELARRIGRRLEAGEGLAEALDAESASLPATYRAVIAAGAESGQLAGALEAFVDSATRVDELRRVTGVALLYPVVLFVIVCWLLAFTITRVLPSFAALDQHPFAPMAWLTDWPLTVPLLSLVLPSAAIIATMVWWRRSGPAARGNSLRWLGRVPGIRRVRRWDEAATFAEMLLLLVERGVPLDRSLRLAADASNDPRLRRGAEQLAEQIHDGAGSGPPNQVAKDPSRAGFPLLIRLALLHASNRALLAGGLRQAATMYRDRASRAAEWYAEYVPILLTVSICGTLTIGFTLLVLWPYASMLHDLAGWKTR